jgi:hypothetical protein
MMGSPPMMGSGMGGMPPEIQQLLSSGAGIDMGMQPDGGRVIAVPMMGGAGGMSPFGSSGSFMGAAPGMSQGLPAELQQLLGGGLGGGQIIGGGMLGGGQMMGSMGGGQVMGGGGMPPEIQKLLAAGGIDLGIQSNGMGAIAIPMGAGGMPSDIQGLLSGMQGSGNVIMGGPMELGPMQGGAPPEIQKLLASGGIDLGIQSNGMGAIAIPMGANGLPADIQGLLSGMESSGKVIMGGPMELGFSQGGVSTMPSLPSTSFGGVGSAPACKGGEASVFATSSIPGVDIPAGQCAQSCIPTMAVSAGASFGVREGTCAQAGFSSYKSTKNVSVGGMTMPTSYFSR